MPSLTCAARHRVPCDMNDPVRVMRWCWLVVAACSADPSLDVTVHHPSGYSVTQTLVTVYFGDATCSDIEFGDKTEAELAAIAAEAVDVTAGGQIVVSRLGGKSIVARGYDAKHRFVTAGCKDVGEIAGATHLEIDAQPTAIVAIDPGQPDRPFAERTIVVNMTDSNGKLLDGTVSWQLTGPAGTAPQTASAGMPTRAGNIKIQVSDLGVPGPEGLRIRAPWATAPLPLVTAFDLSHQTMISLGSGGALADRPSCDVRGHAGQRPTLVCLTPAAVGGHRNAIEIAWNGSQYAPTPIAIPAGLSNQFALFVDHDGSADEPVYVLAAAAGGAGSWYKLGAASGTATTFAASLQNVVYVAKCSQNATTAVVAVQTGTAIGVGTQVQLFTPSGGAFGTGVPGDGEVFSGGCLHDTDHKEHQALVVSGASGDALIELINPNTQTATAISGPRFTGSGFVTIDSQGTTEKRFAGTRLQASGTVVFESVLAPDANGFMLLERTELDAAAPPEKIIAGKLDRDGDTDLMWDMAIGARRRVFQVSLAEQVGGDPLTAMTSGPGGISTTATTATDFLAADLNGLHSDEMILFTVSSVSIYSPDGG
jgi:hypothetical protein